MDSERTRTLAGVALIAGGACTVLGFVTAEVLYPGYSAADQTISALGAEDAPGASQAVFNAAMILGGVLLVGVAAALHRLFDSRAFTGVTAVTGVGVAGVGVFPAHTGAPHFVAAFVAFGGIGVTALVAGSVLRAPFRYVSVALGGLELVAFVLFVALGDGTPLGIGGLERWVAYLGLLWVTAFGGFFLAAPAGEQPPA
ncbi:DUF998 domain-containing protein [Halobacterium bonnevillei]|uniref:DUF998 domain-containing protein n=1 Tax=Halobacterium bonnevillei TaxID=2692200 RepID=A0A6B0SE99_9EURY|nr:DUF998 domain-containing protein [Halobacterium bonnevillei]MXR19277.1 DUF998 domain-containing protein [Halobacterium bonnevillei]